MKSGCILAILFLIAPLLCDGAIAQNRPRIILADGPALKALQYQPANQITGGGQGALEMQEIHKTYFLLKQKQAPLENADAIAIVHIESDGSGILNPQIESKFTSFIYENMPANADLTRSFCEAAWGPSTRNDESAGEDETNRTFTLRTMPSSLNANEEVIFIDTIFAGNKLTKYCIRGSRFKSPIWKKV